MVSLASAGDGEGDADADGSGNGSGSCPTAVVDNANRITQDRPTLNRQVRIRCLSKLHINVMGLVKRASFDAPGLNEDARTYDSTDWHHLGSYFLRGLSTKHFVDNVSSRLIESPY